MSKKKVLSKFTILCRATFIAILGHMRLAGCSLDTLVDNFYLSSSHLFPPTFQVGLTHRTVTPHPPALQETSPLPRAAVDSKARGKLTSKYTTGEMGGTNLRGMLRDTPTYHDLQISTYNWETVKLLLLNLAEQGKN